MAEVASPASRGWSVVTAPAWSSFVSGGRAPVISEKCSDICRDQVGSKTPALESGDLHLATIFPDFGDRQWVRSSLQMQFTKHLTANSELRSCIYPCSAGLACLDSQTSADFFTVNGNNGLSGGLLKLKGSLLQSQDTIWETQTQVSFLPDLLLMMNTKCLFALLTCI